MQDHCERCGNPLQDKDDFCPACGSRIEPGAIATSGIEPGTQFPEAPKLTRCPDCGREISSRAISCPHCGAPIQGAKALVRMIRRDWGFEWKSKTEVFGWPLIHIAFGRKDGKLRVAKGIIAIGQFAIGVFTLAQFGIGILFGFGQFILAPTAIAQFAVSLIFGLGQFATGYIAIGQMTLGYYALAQMALAPFAWTPDRHDPEAIAFFTNLLHYLKLK